MPGVGPPFLRFHPTLAPMLWQELGPEERVRLTAVHRQRYHQLVHYLSVQDRKNPHEARAIARRELPNLLHAVDAAFAAEEPHAVEFADLLTMFLNIFGLPREAERLTTLSHAASGEEGSRAWFLAQSNRGQQLLAAGQAVKAAEVFRRILDRLGDSPSYERAITLIRVGRCFRAGGRLDQAAQCYREGIAVTAKLQPDHAVKRLTSFLHTDLADVLRDTGQYAEARKEYEAGLEVVQDLGDLRAQGVSLLQLGTLGMAEGKLDEAVESYRAALAFFQQLGEPAMEAVVWHQLGMVSHQAGQLDEAERHLREAARLNEERGHLAGAIKTWNALAVVIGHAGKLEAAEQWCWKAIEAARSLGDQLGLSIGLNNLAAFLRQQTARLPEARTLAEEALGIRKTLDPGAAQIWTTYNTLAGIAEQEAAGTADSRRQATLRSAAREYRRLAREHQRNFAGTRHELQPHVPLIAATVMAVQDQAKHALVEEALAGYRDAIWNELCATIRRIVAGERDEDLLQEGQFGDSPMIIATILAALADPGTLEALLPPDGEAS